MAEDVFRLEADFRGIVGPIENLAQEYGKLTRPTRLSSLLPPPLTMGTMLRASDQLWEHMSDSLKRSVLDVAWGAHAASQFVDDHSPFMLLLMLAKSPSLIITCVMVKLTAERDARALLRKYASQADLVRSSARAKFNSAFWQRLKESRAQYNAGNYTRYTSEELRAKVKRH